MANSYKKIVCGYEVTITAAWIEALGSAKAKATCPKRGCGEPTTGDGGSEEAAVVKAAERMATHIDKEHK